MSLRVEKALRKAHSHIKCGELAKAEELFEQVLSKFPKNIKAIQGYQKLKAGVTSNASSNSKPHQEQIQELINLYNQGQFEKVLEKVKPLISLFPKAITLHNIQGASNAALQRYDAAIDSYKQANKIRPDYAEVYYNMGNALKGKGDLDAAIDSYKQAIKIKPNHADAYINMGNALKEKGELDATIDGYKQAIKIKPDHADAYINMGNALKEKGEIDATIDSYNQAIKIKPDYAEAYFDMGNALNDKGRLEAAIASYKQALKIKPDYAEAYSNMGVALMEKGELDAAIDSYKKALKIKPDYAEAHNNMGVALNDKGNLGAAIDSYKQALKIKPDYTEAYGNMGIALKGIKFNSPKTDLPEIIIKLLEKKTYVSPSNIALSTISLIKSGEAFQSVLSKYSTSDLEKTLKQAVTELSEIPLLLKLMALCPISDPEIEQLLTYLRSAILNNVSQLSGSKETLAFQTALALQCFTNEYIYTQTDEDTKILYDLENIVQINLANGQQPTPLTLACLASYKGLNDHPWCHLLVLPDELKQLGKRQVSEVKKETVLRCEIPMLSEIKDAVSSKVRQQYEENPYPRWISLGLPLTARPIVDIAKNLNLKVSDKKIYDCNTPQILVAGCGTGQHSIGTAARFRNCNVLAIDLSLRSLAYAKRKTEELGLKNIEYMQADILDLEKLGRQFDMVESAGVLHHMKYPMVGWSVLTNCLKPGGLMKIGLYSELARQHIVQMREEIQSANFGSDDFSIKSFRNSIINSEQKHHQKILFSRDFYSLSEVRDLLFHVQEHRFTLPQIKNCLKELGLEFCGFEAENIVKKFKLSNIGSGDLYDLDKWNTFEQVNPDTFAGMYQFWSQKI